MKPTRIKISISQDGLLPQESVDVATIEFPFIPKKLLRALGFERVDNSTFVGVMPVFVNLDDSDQEIEIELGVSMPEMRKKILELFQPIAEEPVKPEEPEEKPKKSSKSTGRKTKSADSPAKKSKTSTKKSSGTSKSSKTAKASQTTKGTKDSGKKKSTAKKTTSKRTSSKKTKG